MTSPAQHGLFYVNEDAELLDVNKKENIHSVIAKILNILKRGRSDLETLVSFLTMRVTKSNVDDSEKLKRGCTYVKNTIKYKRIIGAKTISDLFTWIYAAYAVHNDMRRHTGGAISMGYVIIHGKYSKQKINVKISTESELAGMGKYVPYNIWFMMFRSAQGYVI